ncbi:MAG: protoheme IX farnesyltransferase [Acidobacteria bacterium]|nr:MAG: protoheme IX farnesyltransferase [Acidobacteriota bacterium]
MNAYRGVSVDIDTATLAAPATSSRLAAYLELTKPRVNLLVVLTAAAGFYMGSGGRVELLLLLHTLFGTALVAGGSAALNQYMERDLDGRMRRTWGRPLPSGRLTPAEALVFGVGLVSVGSVYLLLLVNGMTSLLGLATSFLYLLIYTPLKTRTSYCTAVGSIPGALPPLMGWAGAAGTLDLNALGLFLILLLWQFPHFLAISWAYRRDYQKGGFSMLSGADPDGRRTAVRIIIYSLVLFGASLLPASSGLTGDVYLAGAITLGVGLLWLGFRAAWVRSISAARKLSLGTIVYLPVLLILMVLNKM